MRKIIDGLLYDTDNYELILSHVECSKYNPEDHNLYKTKKGRYFIHKHSEVLDGVPFLQDIFTITEQEVKKIICMNNIDLYIEMYGCEEA